MKILNLLFIAAVFSLSGCKTFIMYSGNSEPLLNRYNPGYTEKMCIDNELKASKNSKRLCETESSAKKVVLLPNNEGFIFPISKSFISNEFDSKRLKKEVKGKFDTKFTTAEGQLASAFFDWATDGSTKYEREKRAREKEKSYIESNTKYLFTTAYNRFEDSNYDSGIGLKVSLFSYSSGDSNYALARVSFVDMNNSNTEIDSQVYGYVDFFDSPHGGFNVHIPTCEVKTNEAIDGCVLNTTDDLTKIIKSSMDQKTGYGKSLITFSFAKFLPPPEEPKAKGIPYRLL